MQMFWAFKLKFVVDIWPFWAWRLFGLLFEKLGDFLKSCDHPGQQEHFGFQILVMVPQHSA
jgi:hypothetical protein